ncbi:hypothetical protein D3C87_1865100 [compost metagenome]
MLIMTPPFESLNCGIAANKQLYTPFTFTSITRSKSAAGVVSTFPTCAIPALLIKILMLPIFSKVAKTSSWLATLQAYENTFPPIACISSTAVLALSSVNSII